MDVKRDHAFTGMVVPCPTQFVPGRRRVLSTLDTLSLTEPRRAVLRNTLRHRPLPWHVITVLVTINKMPLLGHDTISFHRNPLSFIVNAVLLFQPSFELCLCTEPVNPFN